MSKDIMKSTGEEIMEFLEKIAPLKAKQFKRNGYITAADVMEVIYESLGLGLNVNHDLLRNTMCGWVYPDPDPKRSMTIDHKDNKYAL